MTFHVPLYFVALIAGAYVIAALRRGKVASAKSSGSVHSVLVAAEPAAVFEALLAPPDRYRLDDSDREKLVIVLSIAPTLFTWGFFFPIWIKPAPAGGSIVEIGIQSRLFQWGPLVSRAHHRCVDAVESRLRPATARVVA